MKVVIIGAGPGGYETAVAAAKRGMEVVLITDGLLGGTCLNEGCIPTKTLVRWAGSGESLEAIQERKDQVVSQLRNGIGFLMKSPNIRVVEGHASFVSDTRVRVALCGGQEPSFEEFEGTPIIIATGSSSASLPVPGADLCVTSREMLEMKEVPKELCVIGGGVIGLEFASIFNRLGSRVTVLEYCKQILPRFDTDLCKRLKQCMAKQGIDIKTGVGVTAIVQDGDGLVAKSDSVEVVADKVLMAVGRRANICGLGLENTSVEYTDRGVVVDGNMQTSVPGVYAIGDVVGGMMLAHVATFQGKRALNHIMGCKDGIRFDIVPAAVFTSPEAATVGLTEEDCKARGIGYKAYKSFFRANGKAVSMDETDGYCKLLAEVDTGRILGAHIYGPHSSDIIHEVAVMMNLDATIGQLRDVIHAHPTLSEVILNSDC